MLEKIEKQDEKKNGIYDGIPSKPTVFGFPNGGFKYVVNLTNDFDEPHNYDDIVALLANATEADEIVWNIASHGGYVSTLQMILGWKSMCPAQHTHVLHANADSCAIVFFLSPASQYVVGDGATAFIHEIQAGASGTTSNMERRIAHITKQNKQFVRDTFKDFLTEDEIGDVLKGVEIYLDAEEIRQRLEQREALKQQRFAEGLQETLTSPPDLSKYTEEELQEELEAIDEDLKTFQQDKKTIREELKKRSKSVVVGKPSADKSSVVVKNTKPKQPSKKKVDK